MEIKDIEKYCLSKLGSKINFPFDEKILTFIVGEKIFLLTDIKAKELRINLKCNPEMSIFLREEFEGIIPGYHMNKKHWNTVYLNSDVPKGRILELIDHSYKLVFNSLSKRKRESILIFGVEE